MLEWIRLRRELSRTVDFDNFNEGILLQEQVEGYQALYGYYPELVLVDRIYLNRQNRKFLKDRGIRHSGKPLGRARPMSSQEKQKRKKEQNKRSEIEGKFGQGKSKYGLDDIQTRLEDTSYACIGLILLALNTIKLARAVFIFIFSYCYRQWSTQTAEITIMKAAARNVAYSTASHPRSGMIIT